LTFSSPNVKIIPLEEKIMPLDKKTVEYVAHLARIELDPKESLKLAGQLEDILTFIDRLSQLDTENVLPTNHILPMHNVFRDDQPEKSLAIEDVLSNATHKKGNFFTVPKIIE